MPLRLRGLENLPAGQCVVVANHASYLDGVVMTRGAAAALRVRDQAGDERRAARRPAAPAHRLRVRRALTIATRAPPTRGACCARPPAAIRWCSFPKAPSQPEVGLGKFHTGAFAIAARAACPVVPAVILGTRRNMPATRILPRPGRIEVRYGAPLMPAPPTRTMTRPWRCASVTRGNPRRARGTRSRRVNGDIPDFLANGDRPEAPGLLRLLITHRSQQIRGTAATAAGDILLPCHGRLDSSSRTAVITS